MPRVAVFVNGILPDIEAAQKILHPDDILLGVDGGTRHILQMNLMPQLVIGDLDSLAAADRQHIQSAAIPVYAYPQDKDETDLELALQQAQRMGADAIIVLAALGGRTDQTLANIALLTDPALAHMDIRLDDGSEEILYCTTRVQIQGKTGDTISLLPWSLSVTGIVTTGLKWTLTNATLFQHKTRGISNIMTADQAVIACETGTLLVVHRRQLIPAQ